MKKSQEKFHDDDEAELVNAFAKGKVKSVKNSTKLMQDARSAAEHYLKKDARINIRLSEMDVSRLKRRAAEEGLPYQTLIASILHKFVTGKLVVH